jgi:peptidoglycan/xylan/chitin deacetylase (PgdA/CDA1 family)
MVITLAYHDIVDEGQQHISGFRGAGAERYKVSPTEFRAHLAAIESMVGNGKPTLSEEPDQTSGLQVAFTFDDGGVCGATHAADILEEHAWRGHFFVVTDYIGSSGFLTAPQVRDLRRRGHVIGSHSCSHPARMWSCTHEDLVSEWQRSCAILAEILGEPVTVAAVPGGFYSRPVAEAAACAGVRLLLTSEPTTRPHAVGGCRVMGRYTVYRGMSASVVAAMAAGHVFPRLRQTLWWNIKKAAKRLGGRSYLDLRDWLLRRPRGTHTLDSHHYDNPVATEH